MNVLAGLSAVQLLAVMFGAAGTVCCAIVGSEGVAERRRQRRAAREAWETQLEQWRAPAPSSSGRHRGQQ